MRREEGGWVSPLNYLCGVFRGFLNRVFKKTIIFIWSDRVLVFNFYFYFLGRLRVVRTAKVCSMQTNTVPGSAVFSLGVQSVFYPGSAKLDVNTLQILLGESLFSSPWTCTGTGNKYMVFET
jgi:hypothetical protein